MTPRDRLAAVALAAVLLVGGLLLVRHTDRIAGRELGDFAEYWASGRLAVRGESPYDKDRVRALEHAAGRPGEPVLMYNPPWALTFVLPLGLLDAPAAHLAWQLAQVLALLLTAHLLGGAYGGPGRRGVGWLATFTFLPCYVAVALGQIAPLTALGAALFLAAVRDERDFLAGLACALVSLKPQAALLFWAALALWVVRARRWRLIAGLAAGLAGCLAVPLWLNPGLIGQYRDMLALHPPTQYKSPTWGAALRLALGVEGQPQYFWLQYLAPLVGLAWVAWYWRRHRHEWDWGRRLPLVLLASLATMAYGWFYDLVLALPAVVLVASRLGAPAGQARRWLALGGYAAASAILLVQLSAGAEGFAYIWAAPAYLTLFLLGQPHEEALPPAG